MVVDEVVAEALRVPGQIDGRLFVAGCAERMAQVFTGLRGTDPARGADVDVLVRILDQLWDFDLEGSAFTIRVTELEGFFELAPSDNELLDAVDIYSFYAILVARYACLYRSSGDVEDSVRCAHAALTALGQLDQNLSGSQFFADEKQRQAQLIPMSRDETPRGIDAEQLRNDDRKASYERLVAIQGRIMA